MGDIEHISVRLQSGTDVHVDAWPGSDAAQPVVIVAPGSSHVDWHDTAVRLVASRTPLLAGVSSAYELVQLIWEIGEPVLLLSQGVAAAAWVSQVVNIAPGAVSALAICDGAVPAELVATMHAVPTLILRGRQSTLQSHEDAVRLHDLLPHSMLIEPEDCGDFPAKDNPDATAAALNLFTTGPGDEEGRSAGGISVDEPVDPPACTAS